MTYTGTIETARDSASAGEGGGNAGASGLRGATTGRSLVLPGSDGGRHLVWLSSHHDIEEIRGLWMQLQARAQAHPFQDWHWHNAWMKAGGTGPDGAFIVLVESADRKPLALYPMQLDAWRGPGLWLKPLAQPVCDYVSPLVEPGFAGEVGDAGLHCFFEGVLSLASRLAGWSALRQPATGPWFSTGSVYPYSQQGHIAHLSGSQDDWFALVRSASRIKKDRYAERQLAAGGTVELAVEAGGLRAREMTARAIALKRAQLAQVNISSAFEDPVVRDTFLAAALQPDGPIRAFDLVVGGTVRAAAICLADTSRLSYVIATYRQDELTQWSPGTALLRRILAWSFDNGYTVFDFTVGDEAYKMSWADTAVPLVYATGGRTLAGKMGAAGVQARMLIEQRLRRQERLMPLARRLRGLLRKSG